MTLSLPAYVQTALRRLAGAGFPTYAVGGCVRDSLMGLIPTDYDLATAATPEEVSRVFAGERVIETGVKHGTVTVLLERHPLEITTFRVDGTYSDARRPDAVRFTPSLAEDLARRDFTVNAIAYSEMEDSLIDPYGGAVDIERRVVRCVGAPDARFREDALRILRALRFASVLDFKIAPETAAALRGNAPLLSKISAERVASELCKLLCGENARQILLDYPDVLGVVLPEILPMVGFDQRSPHHAYELWEHTARCVENAPDAPVLRLAALLHDVGKPRCFTLDARGGHFYGHAEASAEMADGILRRLRLDAATRERAVLLVRCHGRDLVPARAPVKRALCKLGPEAYFQLLDLMRADRRAHGPEPRGLTELDAAERLAREILAERDCFSLKDLAVKGGDLIAAGMRPGPDLGAALERLLDAVIGGDVENEKAALLAYLDKENGR